MGIRLVQGAYEQWPNLTHGQHRLLVRMAITARDSDPEPAYWDGWLKLAAALGCNLPHDHDESHDAIRLRANASTVVKRLTRELVKRGAISVRRHGRPGARAEYVLNVRAVDKRPESRLNG